MMIFGFQEDFLQKLYMCQLKICDFWTSDVGSELDKF